MFRGRSLGVYFFVRIIRCVKILGCVFAHHVDATIVGGPFQTTCTHGFDLIHDRVFERC